MEIWTWKNWLEGGGVNDETDDVLVIDGEGGYDMTMLLTTFIVKMLLYQKCLLMNNNKI